ncbi:MAG: glycosyltransferase [Candidatus Eisenbacteria sp.]|nr:glycosyltransferase [Candidatus Eisenbacteria bacterium]
MKIFYLSSSIIPSRQANAVHVMQMCQAFAERGHEVVLFARMGDEQAVDVHEVYGVRSCFAIRRHPWPRVRGLGGLLYGRRVRRALSAQRQPDLFYARDLYSAFSLGSCGRPMIYEAHSPPANLLRRSMEGRLFKRAGFRWLVVISGALKTEYLRLFPDLAPEKVRVAHDGANDPLRAPGYRAGPGSFKGGEPGTGLPGGRAFEPQRTLAGGKVGGPAGLVERTGADQGGSTMSDGRALHVGYVGHLYPGRGMEVIVELARGFPEVTFHIVGGAEQDLAHWKAVCQSAANVRFHGFIPHGALGSFYKGFDIVLAPYQREVSGPGGKGDTSRWMSPLKVFEYMAHGKPIICSDMPVLHEVLQDRTNSLLVDPGDAAAWKAALAELLASADLRSTLGRAARKAFLERYTWGVRSEYVLEGVLPGSGTGG